MKQPVITVCNYVDVIRAATDTQTESVKQLLVHLSTILIHFILSSLCLCNIL